MEQQIKDMTITIADYKEKFIKQEFEQKAHIDKIFVLREVIADLEAQIETKSFNENALADKIKVDIGCCYFKSELNFVLCLHIKSII